MSDFITTESLLPYIGLERMKYILTFDTISSTNDYLKTNAGKFTPGTVVIANGQTAGKGRRGRSFVSPLNEGVYLSYLLKPNCPVSQIPEITAWVAVAAARALNGLCNADIGIKWVNDLVIGGKKVAGILSEMAIEGESGAVKYVISGIGINVRQKGFPKDIKDIAGSVYTQTNTVISRNAVAANLIRELDTLSADFPSKREEYLDYYKNHCVTLGREVVFFKGEEKLTAVAEDIDDDFSLVVRYPDGETESLSSGEVSVRGLYGYI